MSSLWSDRLSQLILACVEVCDDRRNRNEDTSMTDEVLVSLLGMQ
jgi:hypothetical protein